jgi:CHAT domain-containing protein
LLANTVHKLVSQGKEFYEKGDYEHAAQSWEQAVNLLKPQFFQSYEDSEIFTTYTDTVMQLSVVYQALGFHKKAMSVFNEALPIIEKSNNRYLNAMFLSSVGDLYLSLGNIKEAFKYLQKAVKEADLTDNPRVQATVYNDMGNLLTADENYQGAVDIYDECLNLIDSAGDTPGPSLDDLNSRILINLIFTISKTGTFQDISTALDDALKHITNQPDSHNKAENLISVGILAWETRNSKEIIVDDQAENYLTNVAYNTFSKAKQIAENTTGNSRILSHALGQLGQLYEDKSRYSEAIKLTRSAIFFAEQGKNSEILYQWQWQLGRLVKAQGDIENALTAYHKAISTLNPIRREMFAGYRGRKDIFNEKIKPVYLGLAELLLEQAENYEASGNPEKVEEKLKQARDVMELLKTAELQDYFQNECVTAGQKKTMLDRTRPHIALLYPVTLKDSLVLLLTLPDCMKQVSVQVDSRRLRETAMRFRARLQTRSNNQFFYDAWELYDWLIRPVETILTARQIDTLIVVPDGALRLIPFSTLHDRKHYLIEKCAIGTIPAISLTDPKPLDIENAEILLAGISEGVQGFPHLPGVPEELKSIKQIMNSKVVLQDKEYTIDNLISEFKKKPYSIVHLATHGVFGRTQEDCFLLTYDGRLTMNLLEELISHNRFPDHRVELLALSACQTAQGDERAALGLAGIALKAGARGAVATLWYVDDEAATLAISEFYRELKTLGISKAKALQNVQKKLIARRRYRHPGYWGPFLLIGNWM